MDLEPFHSYLAKVVAIGQSVLEATGHAATSIPGSRRAIAYVRSSYKNDPARVVLEVLLFFFAVKYLLSKRYQPEAQSSPKFSPCEIDELVDDWSPEPLAPLDGLQPVCREHCPTRCASIGTHATAVTSCAPDHGEAELLAIPVVVWQDKTRVIIETATGNSASLFNLCTFDVFGLASHPEVIKASLDTLRVYGVGSCGPPGFYGFAEPHVALEKKVAAHLGVPGAILYSQGFSAVSSVIPAFSKRGDLLIVDDGVGFAAQKGVQISRSRVVYFKHNDMVDLEMQLAKVTEDWRRSAGWCRRRRTLERRFIVVEGLYSKDGTVAPLPKLLELKKKYKFRLVLDDSLAYGVLGPRGGGTTDHFGVDAGEVDLLVAQLAGALGSGGGFCAGSMAAIEHQRLSAAAYCFSASMPPMIAAAGIAALNALCAQEPSKWATRIMQHTARLRLVLSSLAYVLLPSSDASPYQHVCVQLGCNEGEQSAAGVSNECRKDRWATVGTQIKSNKNNNNSNSSSNSINCHTCHAERAAMLHNSAVCGPFAAEARFLQTVVEQGKQHGVLLTRAKYNVEQEISAPRPSIRINLSVHITDSEMEVVVESIKTSFLAAASIHMDMLIRHIN